MHKPSRHGSVIAGSRPGRIAEGLGRLLNLGYRITGHYRYDDYRLERVGDLPILVLPSVANPKLLRTGAYFASQLEAREICADSSVLDLGTGSGVCALTAARHAHFVVGTDVNPVAIRCAQINAKLSLPKAPIEFRCGDLFEPVARERFDIVLFNPPFKVGKPRDARDAAWRSPDLAERFAKRLADHLTPSGFALLLLSSYGDASAAFEEQLSLRGYRWELFAQRRYLNETLSILRVAAARG